MREVLKTGNRFLVWPATLDYSYRWLLANWQGAGGFGTMMTDRNKAPVDVGDYVLSSRGFIYRVQETERSYVFRGLVLWAVRQTPRLKDSGPACLVYIQDIVRLEPPAVAADVAAMDMAHRITVWHRRAGRYTKAQ